MLAYPLDVGFAAWFCNLSVSTQIVGGRIVLIPPVSVKPALVTWALRGVIESG